MDKRHYEIAERLEKSLNDKNTLIKFHISLVPEADAFAVGLTSGYIVVNWKITIEGRPLVGEASVSYDMIDDSDIDTSDFIINNVLQFINQAIICPEEIHEG